MPTSTDCDAINRQLLDEIDLLRRTLQATRSANTRALRRAQGAELVVRVLFDQNVRLRRSVRDLEASARQVDHVDDADPPDDEERRFPTVDPELVDLRRLITDLRMEDFETFAPAICWALNNVATITAGLKTETGYLRRPRRAA